MTLKSLAAAGMIFASSCLAAGQASAVSVQADISVTNDNSEPRLTAVLPLGTTVTGSVIFDIDDTRIINELAFRNPSGTFAFNNGADQIFTVNGTGGGLVSSEGILIVTLRGTSSVPSLEFMRLTLDLGLNPYTTTRDLSEILETQATVDVMSFGLTQGFGASIHYFDDAATSTFTRLPDVAAVPLPAGALLLLSGLGGLGLAARRKSST